MTAAAIAAAHPMFAGLPVTPEVSRNYVDNRAARVAMNLVLATVTIELDNGTDIELPLSDIAWTSYETLVPVVPPANSKPEALAAANRMLTPEEATRVGFTLCSFYWHPSGANLPTVLNSQTLPNIWPSLELALKGERARARETAEAFEKLLVWYSIARLPIPGPRTPRPTVAPSAASAAITEAQVAKVVADLGIATKSIVGNVPKMFRGAKLLSEMRNLSAASKVQVMEKFLSKEVGFASRIMDEGAHFVMRSPDFPHAFKILKSTGEILFGKMDIKTMVWTFEAIR